MPDELRDLIGVVVAFVSGGGVWKAIEALYRGRRDKAKAQDRRRRAVDVLHRSRAYLLDLIGKYRRVMRDHGVPEDLIGPLPHTDDPWERYQQRREDDDHG